MKLRLKKKRLFYVYLPLFLILILVLSTVVFGALVGPRTFFVAVVLSNTAPTILINNTAAGLFSVTPIENNSGASLIITFNVTDAEGTANINNSAVIVNVTLNATHFRVNDSGNCDNLGDNGNTRTFSCAVGIAYYDNDTDWMVNVSIFDNARSSA